MSNDRRRAPRSSYNARYPYNKVTVYPSGHEVHFDCTGIKPNGEVPEGGARDNRVRIASASGSYTEISANGQTMRMATGGDISYRKQGQTGTTDGNSDEKTGGHSRSNTSKDSHTETKGQVSSASEGNGVHLGGGSGVGAFAKNRSAGVVGDDKLRVGGNSTRKIDGDDKKIVDGEIHYMTGKDITISSKTRITLVCGGSKIVIGPASINIVANKTFLVGDQHHGVDSENEEAKDKDETITDQAAKRVWNKV